MKQNKLTTAHNAMLCWLFVETFETRSRKTVESCELTKTFSIALINDLRMSGSIEFVTTRGCSYLKTCDHLRRA